MNQLVHVRTEHPAPKIINLIGPTVIVALAAKFFLVSDFAYKTTIKAHFGVSAFVIEPSLQSTMAEGFFTLIRGTAILFRTYLTWQYLWLITASFTIAGGVGIALYREFGRRRALHYRGEKQKVDIGILTGCTIFFVIGLGAVSGHLVAKSMFQSIDAAISSGYHDCSVYRTSLGNFAGSEILADKQRIVVAQVHGVRLFKVDDVLAIVRVP